MRILMLNYEFPPLGGGAANANYYLLKEFAKQKDVFIDLVTSSSKNKFEKVKFSDRINIYKLNVHKKDIHYWKMSEILRWSYKAYFFSKKLGKKYDLCHAWFGWPSGVIAKLLKIPYIVALRGSDVPGYNVRLKKLDKLIFKPLSKWVWKSAKVVVANSQGLKDLALKTLKCNIKVIYNGIDINEFKPGLKSKNEKIRLISTGRLIKRKGYQYLIPALDKRFELVLIGEGDLSFELKKMAKGKDVKFLGSMEHHHIVRELQKSDVFVLPSLNEGMSNSILEAMACGLPIITTNVGGSKELINGNGILVKKKSVDSIKEALNELKSLKEMGKKSRKIAEKMSWENVVGEYRRVYDELA